MSAFEMARADAVSLGSQIIAFVEEPCCDVPLSVDNPHCVWHGYRSLLRKLAELIPHARTVETRAQAHALRFFRDAALLPRYTALGTDHPAFAVLEEITADLNRLIDHMES